MKAKKVEAKIGMTASELQNCDERRIERGARALVSAGRGHWTLGRRFDLGALWYAPDRRRSVGTRADGTLYGEED